MTPEQMLPGTRVVTKRRVWESGWTIPIGSVGTVFPAKEDYWSEGDGEPLVCEVRFDEHNPSLDDWDNAMCVEREGCLEAQDFDPAPKLDTYICSYFLPGDQAILYFRCEAENVDHAVDQLMDAEPTATSPYCEIHSRP